MFYHGAQLLQYEWATCLLITLTCLLLHSLSFIPTHLHMIPIVDYTLILTLMFSHCKGCVTLWRLWLHIDIHCGQFYQHRNCHRIRKKYAYNQPPSPTSLISTCLILQADVQILCSLQNFFLAFVFTIANEIHTMPFYHSRMVTLKTRIAGNDRGGQHGVLLQAYLLLKAGWVDRGVNFS